MRSTKACFRNYDRRSGIVEIQPSPIRAFTGRRRRSAPQAPVNPASVWRHESGFRSYHISVGRLLTPVLGAVRERFEIVHVLCRLNKPPKGGASAASHASIRFPRTHNNAGIEQALHVFNHYRPD